MRRAFGIKAGANRPRSIYQYSDMAPRLSGQTSIFGVLFFVSKSPLGIERQKKLEKFAILTRKPRSHARILIYRTWPITVGACSSHNKPLQWYFLYFFGEIGCCEVKFVF